MNIVEHSPDLKPTVLGQKGLSDKVVSYGFWVAWRCHMALRGAIVKFENKKQK